MNGPAPVLFVDDPMDAVGLLRDVVGASGCRPVVARSTYEAVLALLKEDFAAIVVDVRMPDMLGFELAVLIKGVSRTLAAFCELFEKSQALKRATSVSQPIAKPRADLTLRYALMGSLLL